MPLPRSNPLSPHTPGESARVRGPAPRQMARFFPIRLGIALVTLFAPSLPTRAELPLARLTAIFPAGGQAGSTVELTLSGQDLDDVTRLHFRSQGMVARPKTSA